MEFPDCPTAVGEFLFPPLPPHPLWGGCFVGPYFAVDVAGPGDIFV